LLSFIANLPAPLLPDSLFEVYLQHFTAFVKYEHVEWQAGTRQAVAANPSLLHTPADNSENVGDIEHWTQVKADIIKICGPKFGRKVSPADQVI
jgi:hypothetical protein